MVGEHGGDVSWPYVRLSRFARTVSGTGFPPEEQGLGEGDLPFLKVSDLSAPGAQGGLRNATSWITNATAQRLGARTIPPGATVFPKVGAALFNNVRAYVGIRAVADNNVMAVVPTAGMARYWYWVLRTIDMGALSEGGALPFVSDTSVRAVPVPWPPEDAQRRIADFLDDQVSRADKVISLRTAQLALLAARRTSMVYDLVTGRNAQRTREHAVPWADRIAADWDATKISFVAQLGSGHTPSRQHPEWWVDCDVPWITTGEVWQVRDDRVETLVETREKLSRLGLRNSSAELHPAGTVVLSRTASAGFSAVMGLEMATSQDFVTWTCGPRLDPYYLLWCLRAMRGDLLGRLAMGSTHKTIYVPDVQTIRIPLPKLDVQRAVVARLREAVGEVDQTADLMEREITLLTERKQALITAAVTGEFDVSAARTVG